MRPQTKDFVTGTPTDTTHRSDPSFAGDLTRYGAVDYSEGI
jgi:hypothetical protein